MTTQDNFAERRKNALAGYIQNYEESKSVNENRFSYVDKAKLMEMGIEKYTNKVGVNVLQIMPSANPDKPFAMRIYYHCEGYKPSGTKRFNYPHALCLDKMFNQPCPICETGQLSTVPDSLKSDFRINNRFLMLVASLSPKDDPNKIYYLDCPKTLFDNLITLIKPDNNIFGGDEESDGSIIDPTDFGNYVAFKFIYTPQQSGNPATYTLPEFKKIPQSYRFPAIPKTWKEVPELGTILKAMDYDSVFSAWSLSNFRNKVPPVTGAGAAVNDSSFNDFFSEAKGSSSDDDISSALSDFYGGGQEDSPAEDFTAASGDPVKGAEESMKDIEKSFAEDKKDKEDFANPFD
jgi:hypothetical protein